MGKSEEVDQPDRDNQSKERALGNEVDTGEVDGEEETDDGHQDSELHIVEQPAAH